MNCYAGGLKPLKEEAYMFHLRTFLITALLALGGCAGRHSIPPHDFAYAPAPKLNTIRVAFDQDGSLYPTAPDDGVYTATPLSNNCLYNPLYSWFKGCSYRLHVLEQFNRRTYKGYSFYETNAAVRNSVVYRLNKSLAKTGRLVIKIHGFNNGFEDANSNFAMFDERMTESDHTVLEVYWDGLVKTIPFSIWDTALLYSNLAGQIGLRGILNRIDTPYELVFITHSRGAAVALSAISDPINDKLCAPQYDLSTNYAHLCGSYMKEVLVDPDTFPRFEPFKTENIQSLKVLMVAPALGNGHFWPGMNRYLNDFKRIDFYIAANKRDIATTKLFAPSSFGDTRLGNDKQYIREVQDMLESSLPNMHMQVLWFESGFYHGVSRYFGKENGDKPECLMWAGGLQSNKPSGCKLTQ